jgi:hypothetical protein
MDTRLSAQMLVSCQPITTRPRKLRARWTEDFSQSLTAFGLGEDDIEGEILTYSTMRQVRISKEKLLEVLKKNRETHRELFLEAQETYREVAIKALDEQLAAAREGRPFQLASLTSMEAPQDHTAEYSRAIGMLEMCEDEALVVSNDDYRCYVEDIWGWSRQWAFSNMKYVNASSRHYPKMSALASED